MIRLVMLGMYAAMAITLAPTVAAAQASDGTASEQDTNQGTAIEQRADQVVALLNGDAEARELFTDSFLMAVSTEQLATISDQLTSQFGAALSVESVNPPDATRAALAIRMERAIARGGIAIDPANGNRISELLFQSFEPIDDSVEKIKTELTQLPGSLSAYFGPIEGAPGVISINSEAQMPLGSTMKLYVLAALGREIAQGKRSWDDVVTIDAHSFPSGAMQDWPLGSPVTLHTLASMMISISDNTATDQLIAELGQPAMAQILYETAHTAARLNTPWMTTRNMFLLKGGNPDRLKTYAAADAEVRAQILAGIEDEPVERADIQSAFAGGPVAIDVEWFANTSDLANLFQVMRAECDPEVFEIMAINTSASPAIAQKWDYIGYKGGSEPGVLNLTWLLRDKAGRDRMLSMSWANPDAALEDKRLELIAQRILSLGE